jgi:hypothetical protein
MCLPGEWGMEAPNINNAPARRCDEHGLSGEHSSSFLPSWLFFLSSPCQALDPVDHPTACSPQGLAFQLVRADSRRSLYHSLQTLPTV